jgi:hypothetical protein
LLAAPFLFIARPVAQRFTLPTASAVRSNVRFFPRNLFILGIAGFLAGLVSSVLTLVIFPVYVYPNLYHYDHISWMAAAVSPYLRYGGLYIPALSFGLIVGGALCLRREINPWDALVFTFYAVIGNCAAVYGPAVAFFAYEWAFGMNPFYVGGTDLNRFLHDALTGYLLGLIGAMGIFLLSLLVLSMVGTSKRFGPLIVLGGLCGTLLMIMAPQGEITHVRAGLMAAFFEVWQIGIAALIGYFIDKARHQDLMVRPSRSLL